MVPNCQLKLPRSTPMLTPLKRHWKRMRTVRLRLALSIKSQGRATHPLPLLRVPCSKRRVIAWAIAHATPCNWSSLALGAMTDYIKKEFGEQYHQYRTFKTKSAGAQEAHEAIRPTTVSTTDAGADAAQKKLYS